MKHLPVKRLSIILLISPMLAHALLPEVQIAPPTIIAQPIIATEPAALPPVVTNVARIIAAKHNDYLSRPDFPGRAADMTELYAAFGNGLIWLSNADGEKASLSVLALLDGAAEHGLTAGHYDSVALRKKLPEILQSSSDMDKALYDTAISIALLRFMHNLHYGQVNPISVGFALKPRSNNPIDLPLLISNAVTQQTIDRLASVAEPASRQYQKLKLALASYRQLSEVVTAFALPKGKSIGLGDAYPQAISLRDRLLILGDMPVDAPNDPASLLTESIVAGIKKFQARHGLKVDGRITKYTVAALNKPIASRVLQLEMAMERERWLPEIVAGPAIVVNIPAFQLWPFNDIGVDDVGVAPMRVVVGKAKGHQTPVLAANLTLIDFMPTWNVPYSIASKEFIPKLLRNGAFLSKDNMELVSSSGQVVSPVFIDDAAAQIRNGQLRVRQKPGVKNALGKVKFIFPNNFGVYLHDTPSKSFFNDTRRDFSHGCVRVAEPQRLAEFTLKDREAWTGEAITLAMNGSRTREVALKKTIPVRFLYTTAYVEPNNTLAFYEDIYGHDDALASALGKSVDVDLTASAASASEIIVKGAAAETIKKDAPVFVPIEAGEDGSGAMGG